MKKTAKNNWIISIIVNGLIALTIFAIGDITYESTDDYYVAIMLKAGENCILSFNKYVCIILGLFQKTLPGINTFVLFGILASFTAFTVFYKIILDKNHGVVYKAMVAAIIAVFSWDHYAAIQYTKVCSLLALVSLMVFVDALINRRNLIYYILAAIGVFFSAGIRSETILVSIVICACYLGCSLVDRDSSLRKGPTKKEMIKSGAVVLAVLIACFALNSLSASDTEISEYRQYNDLRSAVIDYPVYENYDYIQDDLKEIGISKNDISLIDKWYVDFDGAASSENFKAITDIYSNVVAKERISYAVKQFYKETKKWIRNVDRNGSHIIILFLLFIGGLVIVKPKKMLFVVAIGAVTILFYIYLHYTGRVIYRGTYILDLGATLWILYHYDAEMIRERIANSPKKICEVLCVCLLLVSIMLQYPFYSFASKRQEFNVNKIMEPELSEYIESNKQNVYVIATREKGNPEYFANPLTIPDQSYRKNLLDFGGWETKSPYELDRLRHSSLNNVFSDIIDNESAYVIDSKNKKALEKYFNKWYGKDVKRIVFEPVDSVAGHDIWRVVSETAQ